MTKIRRRPSIMLRTARGRSNSSARWLARQLNDPWVAEAKAQGYRSRSAFKLAHIDEKYGLLGKARRIVDLGCAPGGWLQFSRRNASPQARIIGVDVNEITLVPGSMFLQADIRHLETGRKIVEKLGGAPDLVLSDMAEPMTGHRKTDRLRAGALAEQALLFAKEQLEPGGHIIVKTLGNTEELREICLHMFAKFRYFKPISSRRESSERYLIGFSRLSDAVTDAASDTERGAEKNEESEFSSFSSFSSLRT